MILLDAHNDTAYRMYFEKEGLKTNSFHVNLKRQEAFHTLLVYAIFMDPDKMGEFDSSLAYFEALYDNFMKELDKNSETVMLTRHAGTLVTSKKQQAMLSVEGGSLIESVETVDYLIEKGVRMLTLTWNDSNRIAKSAMSGEKGGLSSFGYEIVDKMNRLGMVADLSHASDETFWDVISYTDKPILVSHSNSRSVCNHPRNITDEMFGALIQNGGVLGINFYPPFLGEPADINAIFSHLEHFLSLGGENHIGFGSDFDGVDTLPQGIRDISSFQKMVSEMERRNWTQELIEKICYKNMMRILQ